MDLRRVSRVGKRLSTSQVVGYIAITAEKNPGIKDTSSRESLKTNIESQDLYEVILDCILFKLEEFREKSRNTIIKESPFKELFEQLSAKPVLGEIRGIIKNEKIAGKVIPVLEEYQERVEKTIGDIEKRFFYYSRLASLGVLSAIIMHEIRNRTMIIGGFLSKIKEFIDNKASNLTELLSKYNLANNAIHTLERLADRFAPLASRAYGTRRRNCFLKDVINECVEIRHIALEKKKIVVNVICQKNYYMAVDSGDLSTIILNLLDNSLFWLSEIDSDKRKIQIKIHKSNVPDRILVEFDDSGPGVDEEYREKIFWPGVTRKSDGLGMGLTVTSELIDQYNGRMCLAYPGNLSGASFRFDLPILESEGNNVR